MMIKKLFLVLLLLLPAACEQSPTGRRQVTLLPDSQVAALGEKTFTEIKNKQPIETDPRINAYVGCVAQALVRALPDQKQPWELVVFRNPAPNAFALPGGKIGIHTGLLNVARTPDQLAAVIGHEIGHVLADHTNERLTQTLAVQGGLMLVDLLSENRGSAGHQLLMEALGLGAQVGVLLPFSRTHESEADAIGLELMAKAGFDPRQSLTLWQNMARLGSQQPLEFLSTHPSHESRFQELNARMDQASALYRDAQAQGRHPQCSLAG